MIKISKDQILKELGTSNIRTFTGKWVDVFDLKEESIDIKDIAHALSLICRFNGHTKEFYSVAQHCIWVCNKLPIQYKLGGLLHDASESYLNDIPSPFKNKLPGYKEIEEKVTIIICKHFGVEYPFSKKIKKVDFDSLVYEYEYKVLQNLIYSMPPEQAEFEFLKLYNELTNA